MNLSKTAEILYIHRSTLTYRLNRIQSEGGIDLEDYKSRLYAMLSLEFFGKQSRSEKAAAQKESERNRLQH